MTLREARITFTSLLAELILEAKALGYEVALDEATEHITAKDPTSDHRQGSLHHMGLAADLNLYFEGYYLSTTEDHERLGEIWEAKHVHCKWGGRFNDGNHYAFAPPELVGQRK